jgi:hypothetical protein
MDPASHDAELRQAAFSHVDRRGIVRGSILDSTDLAGDFAMDDNGVNNDPLKSLVNVLETNNITWVSQYLLIHMLLWTDATSPAILPYKKLRGVFTALTKRQKMTAREITQHMNMAMRELYEERDIVLQIDRDVQDAYYNVNPMASDSVPIV